MDYIPVEVPVRLWWLVDGCVDNTMSVDAVDLVADSLLAGACVRDAGWRASSDFVGNRDQYGWPTAEQLLRIVLRREHWKWVIDQLRRWDKYSEESYDEVLALIEGALSV